MTNNQLTKEWLQQTIAELESVRDEIPFGIDTNSELELAAFKMALAAMDSEQVAEVLSNRPGNDTSTIDMALPVVTRLYRHSQQLVVPVVPEEMPEHTGPREFGRPQAYVDGWNACRAAMLQAEPVTTANKLCNSPVIPDGYVMVPKVPTAEMQSAGASAIRIETTALNKLWTGNAVFRAMLAAATQGKS
ncbi:hypothetical protein GZZ44_16360 [Klebsiella aerogenes]|uniref:hypothetical protein n=1 Tax=Klebsiella aerogenes TaxID=548 RepID=UPI00190EA279|nr:hypothetical protein [Klebsiella aerogenes]MBK0634524.1 hypothetical protein [Klebsiella aerogenes]